MLSPEITLTGIVTASSWDKNNEVDGITIAVDGEKEYIIVYRKHIEQLIPLIRREIEVTGKLTTDAAGNNYLSISNCRIIK